MSDDDSETANSDPDAEPVSAGPSRKAGIEAIFFRGLPISQPSRSNLFLPHQTLEVAIIQELEATRIGMISRVSCKRVNRQAS